MSKVEEIVADVFSYVDGSGPKVEEQMREDIARLIAAAKEEGRKEGYDAGYGDGRTDWYLHHPPLV